MAVRSSFFNSVNGDRRYLANNFAEYFASFIANGIFPNPSNTLQVYEKTNMTVTVKPGKGWINGYFAVNEYDYDLTLDNADGVLNRIDRIVLRLDFNARAINITVKKGTFASTPVAPTLQRDADAHELALADVYVTKGATTIRQSNITDQRLNNVLCGVVHGTVSQVDTTTIFNQYSAWFSETTGKTESEINQWQLTVKAEFDQWFASIQNILDGDVAANLAARITTLEQNLAMHQADDTAHGIGDKATLKTKHKSTIVGAVNELFTDVDNGKTQIANAIVGKNGTASSSDTFTQLASAISVLGGGVKSVQRGSLNEQLSSVLSKNITISAVNPDNTIVLIDNYGDTSNAFSRVFKTIELVNDVTIKIESGAYYAALYDNWQVLEFDKLKSKQSGVVQLNRSETSKDISLKKVDLSKIGVFFSWTTDSSNTSTGGNDSLASHMPRLVVANDSTLTISRQKLYTPVGTITLRWQVVEFE